MRMVSVGIIGRGELVLACQRKQDAVYPLKWEFPGGKVEPGETPRAALQREIAEELGLNISVGDELGTFPTALGKYRIHLQCFWCSAESGDPQLNAHSAVTGIVLNQAPIHPATESPADLARARLDDGLTIR